MYLSNFDFQYYLDFSKLQYAFNIIFFQIVLAKTLFFCAHIIQFYPNVEPQIFNILDNIFINIVMDLKHLKHFNYYLYDLILFYVILFYVNSKLFLF